MRISKRLREQAASIMQLCASSDRLTTMGAQHWLGYSDNARIVASCAWKAAVESPFLTHTEVYAEAECLLRCGWSPE